MRITIFGSLGNVGSRVVAEALSREHDVTAVVRDPCQFSRLPVGVKSRSCEVSKAEDVIKHIDGQDIVISAVRPTTGNEGQLVPITDAILQAGKHCGVRVLIVGGAASLNMPGKTDETVLTAPGFLPSDVLNIARACFAQHNICLNETDADWVYLSPPAMLFPGERSGRYRLGADELLIDSQGASQISMEDFAAALIDEAEQPKHYQTRFTVAY